MFLGWDAGDSGLENKFNKADRRVVNLAIWLGWG